MQSPPIDPRDRAALAAQLTALAQARSAWRPPSDGRPDLGAALVEIVARYAEQVVERLNRAPERGYLAFLNLIGTQPLPPVPARVPLTFMIAEGSTAPARVPVGTQVAAPPSPTRPEEVVFETEDTLVLNRAVHVAVVVVDPVNDRFTDLPVTADATSKDPTAAFWAFVGTQPQPHQLFVSSRLLALQGSRTLELTVDSLRAHPWPDQVSWTYWDGEAWQPALPQIRVSDVVDQRGSLRTVRHSFPGLPAVAGSQVGGLDGHWLRAQFDGSVVGSRVRHPPEAIAVGRRPPRAMEPGVVPFADRDAGRWFYLGFESPTGTTTSRVRIRVTAQRWGRVAARSTVQLAWSYRVGDAWKPVGTCSSSAPTDQQGPVRFSDDTKAFTEDGEVGVSFDLPADLVPSVFNGVVSRWLRVELADDHAAYRTPPVLEEIELSYEPRLPEVIGIQLSSTVTPTPPVSVASPISGALLNGVELDVSKDFLPFGEQPRFNDTCYLECPAAAVDAESYVLSVSLTNATGKASPVKPVTAAPVLLWETFDGAVWRPATSNRPKAFTEDGDVVLRPAAPPMPTEIGGRGARWVRVRLMGDYGGPAQYTVSDDGSYAYTPDSYAPPIIAVLGWRLPTSRAGQAEHLVLRNGDREDVVSGYRGGSLIPFTPTADPDPALYLGFDRPLDPAPVTIYLPMEPPAPHQVTADRLSERTDALDPVLTWEYWGPGGWQHLAVVDETAALRHRGLIRFVGPSDGVVRDVLGRSGYWVRVRWSDGEFPFEPRLRGVRPNTIWASQVTTVREEILGSGNGVPSQTFSVTQPPVLPGQQLWVREATRPGPEATAELIAVEGPDAIAITTDDAGHDEEVWVRWHAVPDLWGSGTQDRQYTVEPMSGAVTFGDGQAGLLPPVGQNNVRITYRTGGGEAGNCPAGTVTELKSSLPSVDSVVNHDPAQGGSAREPLERVKRRGPAVLRHRNRGVTAQDLEDLALEASAEVARARALSPVGFDPTDLWLNPAQPVPQPKHLVDDAGRAGIIVVPHSLDARPTPTLALLERVRGHVRERAAATADVWVSGPEWITVTVTATVVPVRPQDADVVGAAVGSAIERYLHPLTGGSDGLGWAFGREPHRSDLFPVVRAAAGVDQVRSLSLRLEPQSLTLADRVAAALNRPLAQGGGPVDATVARWLQRALVGSGDHQITVALDA